MRRPPARAASRSTSSAATCAVPRRRSRPASVPSRRSGSRSPEPSRSTPSRSACAARACAATASRCASTGGSSVRSSAPRWPSSRSRSRGHASATGALSSPGSRRWSARRRRRCSRTSRTGAHRLEVAGAAPLGGWQDFLAGRSKQAPRDFALLTELEDVRLRAGDDLIDELEGRVAWKDDRLEVGGLRARLGGRPLPVLDLEVEGISSFFATDPERRQLRASAPPLAGLGALWKDLHPDDDDEPGRMPVALGLAIERLEHPMFLWPIEGLAAEITPIEQGVRVEARNGTWGGVPIELAADWLFEPEERVVAHVVAGRGDLVAGRGDLVAGRGDLVAGRGETDAAAAPAEAGAPPPAPADPAPVTAT